MGQPEVAAADAAKDTGSVGTAVADPQRTQDEIIARLAQEVVRLERYLHWRTIALEILLLGVASITAVIWLTRWWPW